MTSDIDDLVGHARALVDPVLRTAIDHLADPQMRLVSRYQMGWVDADGHESVAGGKAMRPAFTVLAAEAVGADPAVAAPAAAAVELVHNFSLLHDDVMDRDVERRHRPTGWVVFGEGQAILAGSAMLTAAIDLLATDGRTLQHLLAAIQDLIAGQSQDLLLEGRDDVTLDDVIAMEAGKTAALLSCATSIGALAAGASAESVEALGAFGYDVGIAFQLVDDILGVVGDPARTGKSSSSDVRAGKRSAPVVAALQDGGPASLRLREMLAVGAPAEEEDVVLATKLIAEAGGLHWAAEHADERMASALDRLRAVGDPGATAGLEALARYVVDRDR